KDFLAFNDGDADHSSDDDELVFDFLKDFGLSWFRWIKAAGRKLLNIQAAASSIVKQGKKPHYDDDDDDNNSNVPAFNINDAATFFDATVIPAIGPFVAEARDALVRAANDFAQAGAEPRFRGGYTGSGSNSSNSNNNSGDAAEARRRRAAAGKEKRVVIEEVVQMEDVEEKIKGGYDHA
ncbi:hypothetical protein HK100_001997, partial [Physocladia obscura]